MILIAGPCAVEDYKTCDKIAKEVKTICIAFSVGLSYSRLK